MSTASQSSVWIFENGGREVERETGGITIDRETCRERNIERQRQRKNDRHRDSNRDRERTIDRETETEKER